MTWLLNIFGNIKNVLMALGAAIIGGYVLSQKYKAYKAEDKLKTIENKIAKSNVVVAKEIAKAKAQAKEIEHSSEVATLKDLKKEKEKVLKEMDEIEETISKTKTDKEVKRKRGKALDIEI